MARRSKKSALIPQILTRLEKIYPRAECALEYRDAFELLCATILSAQCTDVRVNLVTPALFARYPTPAALAVAEQAAVEQLIFSTGFYRNKTKSLIGSASRLVAVYDGQVPRTMAELLTLPGVARKTANVVLGTFYGLAEGVVVDTHVARLSGLLGLSKGKQPVAIERDLMAIVPTHLWVTTSHRLILHGRAHCVARRPRCGTCPLADLCPSAA